MRILNSIGTVFGLMAYEAQEDMRQKAEEDGAKVYAYDEGWNLLTITPNWFSDRAYRVEIPEVVKTPLNQQEFIALGIQYTKCRGGHLHAVMEIMSGGIGVYSGFAKDKVLSYERLVRNIGVNYKGEEVKLYKEDRA